MAERKMCRKVSFYSGVVLAWRPGLACVQEQKLVIWWDVSVILIISVNIARCSRHCNKLS